MNAVRSVLVIVALSVMCSLSAYAGPKDKVTICHKTGSETKPYVKIEPSQASYENNPNEKGHFAHEGDLFFDGDVPCPGSVIDPDDPDDGPETVLEDGEAVSEEVVQVVSDLTVNDRDVKDMSANANFTSLQRIIDRLDARHSSFE